MKSYTFLAAVLAFGMNTLAHAGCCVTTGWTGVCGVSSSGIMGCALTGGSTATNSCKTYGDNWFNRNCPTTVSTNCKVAGAPCVGVQTNYTDESCTKYCKKPAPVNPVGTEASALSESELEMLINADEANH
jgi:hypothetical protein